MKAGYAYIVASGRSGTIYTGVTADLVGRAWQHRTGAVDGFTKEHGCTRLVWFEAHDDLQEARQRELRVKKWNRIWKLRLIEERNPMWADLFDTLV